jgi:hypothetical protein
MPQTISEKMSLVMWEIALRFVLSMEGVEYRDQQNCGILRSRTGATDWLGARNAAETRLRWRDRPLDRRRRRRPVEFGRPVAFEHAVQTEGPTTNSRTNRSTKSCR